jgi:hypothetical protein
MTYCLLKQELWYEETEKLKIAKYWKGIMAPYTGISIKH